MKSCAKIAMLVVAALTMVAAPAFAQRLNSRQRRAERKAQKDESVQAHAGDWLRKYKDLPPEEQRKALENDPDFKKLPPQRQTQLLERLQRFSSLPRRQQERMLSRMETWEHLTLDQKRQARNLFQEIQQLPPERRRKLTGAIRGMR